MAFSLFQDQAHDVKALRVLQRSNRAILYQLPTGGGKTVVAGFIAQRLRANGFKILVLVHRKELVRQFINTLRSVGLADDVGIICPGFTPTPWAPIQIGMVFSWVRRRPAFQPDFIFVDEAHHIRASSWETVLDWYPEARIMGMTATPRRLDDRGLKTHFSAMHCGLSVPALIQRSRLSPIRVLRVPVGFRRKGVRKSHGDFSRAALDERANAAVVGNSVKAYTKYLPGRRTIMFGVTKRHARVTAERLQAEGVAAAYVGDDTPAKVRDRTFEDFGDGRLDVICNVGLVDEGFDVPACDAVMDVAHTMSVVRYMQRAGRTLRFLPDKEAILLDLVGNSIEHGRPDIDRAWSLEDGIGKGEPIYSSDAGNALRCCRGCLTMFPPRLSFCPHCGAEHDGRPVVEVDVELIEDGRGPRPEPKPKPEPKLSKRERGQLLYEARVRMNTGDPEGAWRLISDKGREVGYHPNWAWMLADYMKIPQDARR